MDALDPVVLQVEVREGGGSPQCSEVLQEVVVEVQHRETVAVGEVLLCGVERMRGGWEVGGEGEIHGCLSVVGYVCTCV